MKKASTAPRLRPRADWAILRKGGRHINIKRRAEGRKPKHPRRDDA